MTLLPLLIFLNVLVLTGCSQLKNPSVRSTPSASSVIQQNKKGASHHLANVTKKALNESSNNSGVVFAKTDFQGILKTNYVKLILENLDHPAENFQLNIGDQPNTIWTEKTVQPGYFFVKLPAGKYRISSLAIPVGSTMANEEMNVSFEVLPNAITYIGTLRVIGIKEKIKLGGVPVIQPGFEYNVEILDESKEGIAVFRKNYPQIMSKISVQLLQSHPVSSN